MIRDHKFYEMQSALAAAGQLTDTELTELEQHVAACASCRECIAEMAEVSREFFLVQAAKMKCKEMPAGMQERFLERAANAGIPFSRPARAQFAPMFVRVAVVAVLLAISASLSWKMLPASDAERKAALDESQPLPSFAGTPHIAGEHAMHHVSMRKAQPRRGSATRHNAVSIASVHGITEARQSYFEPSRPFFARYGSTMNFSGGSALWSDGLAATPPSFTNAYVANCFGHEEGCKPEERAFHLQIKLASLSLLDSPQSLKAELPTGGLKFSAPAFHLAPNRAW